MNLLYIGHEKKLNGASLSLLNLVTELKDRHKIYVLLPYGEGPVYDAMKNAGVEVLSAEYYLWCDHKTTWKNWCKKRFLWNLYERRTNKRTAKRLANFVKEKEIQVIHSNTSVINLGGLLHKYTGVKHVWHIREFGDLDFQIYPLGSTRAYRKFMNKQADHIVCISQAVASHHSYLDKNKVEVVYNGVAESYGNVQHIENHEKVNFLVAGRICQTKGQAQVVEAARLLLAQGIEGFYIHFAGVEKELLPIPEELSSYVTKTGFVLDMVGYRSKIDVEIVASVAEAFGRGTAEAMMGGIPVIGSRSGGTPELILHERTGLLYESGNVQELAAAMKKLILEPSLREQMGKNAGEYARSNFTIQICGENLESIYEA